MTLLEAVAWMSVGIPIGIGLTYVPRSKRWLREALAERQFKRRFPIGAQVVITDACCDDKYRGRVVVVQRHLRHLFTEQCAHWSKGIRLATEEDLVRDTQRLLTEESDVG